MPSSTEDPRTPAGSCRALLLGLLILCPLVSPAEIAGESAPDVEEIAPGVYIRHGRHAVVFEADGVANVGFIVGERCVAVIDSGGSYAEGEALSRAIRRVTSLPVCYVVNTHVHPDHMLGNLVFERQGAEMVGHARLERAMAMLGDIYLKRAEARVGRPLGPEHIVFPDIAIEDELDLDLGGRVLHLQAYATAHTDNDLSVYDARTGTLFLGDLLFIEHLPVIAGSLKGWIGLLEELRCRPAERVVPGHGPAAAAWPEAADDAYRYLTLLRDETRAWIAADGDLRQAQAEVGYTEAESWELFESYHKRNVSAAYTELEWED